MSYVRTFNRFTECAHYATKKKFVTRTPVDSCYSYDERQSFLGGGKEKTSEGEDEGAQKRRRRRPRLLLFPMMLRTRTTKTQMN